MWIAYAAHANDVGIAYPSQSGVARLIGHRAGDPREVRRARQRLAAVGALEILDDTRVRVLLLPPRDSDLAAVADSTLFAGGEGDAAAGGNPPAPPGGNCPGRPGEIHPR